jgi:hypothetical protein
MEIKEIVSFYINDTTKTLDVTFRTLLDSEDELREDKIYFEEVRDFGYDFINDEKDDYRGLIDEEFEDDYDEDYYDESNVDEQELISFLNEYYLIYPSKLPDSEIF